MEPGTPTHFNAIIVGTGLSESIVSAALSKAGYSVLQLDQSSDYGDQWASLSLQELSEWASTAPGASTSPTAPPTELLPIGQRFALSLFPTLLRARGPAIDVLVRSKVALYLSFGKLSGIGLWTRLEQSEGEAGDEIAKASEGKGKGKVERVPSSKADVFNHANLSLIEKRRLTKLLLLAASKEPLADDPRLSDPELTLQGCLQKAFSLSPGTSSSLTYSLALCTTNQDLALPALERLRTFIHSSGRYGASPFLVGHYGGAGDLVGGFSRMCAVWGGGQILGRPIEPLILDAKPGIVVPPAQSPFFVHSSQPPPPVVPSHAESTPQSALGVPVRIEKGQPADVFTADWIIAAQSHVPVLFPKDVRTSPADKLSSCIISIHAIVILPEAIPFPNPKRNEEAEGGEVEDANDIPDSSVFVFAPKELSDELGTLTVLQVGPGTFACPSGSFVLYLDAPVLLPTSRGASSLLSPYLDALFALSPSPIEPCYSVFYASTTPSERSSSLPSNLLIVPPPPSSGRTHRLATALDEAVVEAERIFWTVVGEAGSEEGVEFFEKGQVGTGDEEEEEQ
ncbi:BQ2448_3547 [Microbotryum intermedium]|uniref:BQ2448_3547 protein n=1 Tax=Microbotryum intermedium TaxID=269621 RepID=A0A238FC58_9BASI|nr:BQ2448_3547 [Microbotryum intermedium]